MDMKTVSQSDGGPQGQGFMDEELARGDDEADTSRRGEEKGYQGVHCLRDSSEAAQGVASAREGSRHGEKGINEGV